MTARSTVALLAAAALMHTAAASPSPSSSPPTTAPPGVERPAVIASNTFGVNLFKQLAVADPRANLFVSPYSVAVALTMVAEGARGQTEAEMERVLGFPPAPGNVRPVVHQHAGHAAIAARFERVSGAADPATRARIEALRKRLDAANADAEAAQRARRWERAADASEKAERLASELNNLLTTVDRFDLRIANALWVDESFPLLPAYVATINRSYAAGGVTSLDIARDTEASRLRINAWVEEHTERRIKDLIPQRALTPTDGFVVTNAVYFKGQWADPFAESATTDEDFTLPGGGVAKCRLMRDHRRSGVPFAAFNADGTFFETPFEVPRDESKRPRVVPDKGGFSIVELPYKGRELSMVVIAPISAKDPAALAAIERKLTADVLDDWLARLSPRTVDTAIPRFKLEVHAKFAEQLKAMGMERAFVNPGEPGGAEFPGISDSADPTRRICIAQVLHKAWVEVTEKGTEAAAATAVVGRVGSAAPPVEMVPYVPTFRADQPFLFLIRDTKTGLILFMGRCANPA